MSIVEPRSHPIRRSNRIDVDRGMTRLGVAARRGALVMALIVAAAGCSPAPVTDAAQRRAVAISTLPQFQEPPGWRWGSLVNADGARLRFGWTDPAAAIRGVVVLVPSFQAPAEEYFETARDLRNHGFAVWILDRRGQGGSDRWPGADQRGHLGGGLREVRDLRQFTLLAVDRYQRTPAYLVGESLGGLIGLRLLHDSPGLFAAAAFSSPGIDFQTNGVPRAILKGLTASACAIGLCAHYAPTQNDWGFDAKAGGPADPTKDDPTRALAIEGRLLAHPELREGGATNGFVRTLFEEAETEESPGWPEGIRTPVLFGYTPADRISRADVIQWVCRRMPRCTLARFTTSGHALFSDADRTRGVWMRQLESFLDQWPPRG